MAGAIICLLFSTIFHLFCAVSAKVYTVLARLDYSGISLLILGSTFPPIVYGFACFTWVKLAYLALMTTFCTLAFVATLLPSADMPEYRKLRGILFIIVGLSAGASPFHAAISGYAENAYRFY